MKKIKTETHPNGTRYMVGHSRPYIVYGSTIDMRDDVQQIVMYATHRDHAKILGQERFDEVRDSMQELCDEKGFDNPRIFVVGVEALSPSGNCFEVTPEKIKSYAEQGIGEFV